MFLVFCKTCHSVGGVRKEQIMHFSEYATVVFGVEYIRVAVDSIFLSQLQFDRHARDVLSKQNAHISRLFLEHKKSGISSSASGAKDFKLWWHHCQWEAWCCHWHKVHWKNLQWCCSSYCQVRGGNYVRNWQGLETVWQSLVSLRVDITLIQRFSDPEISNLRSCSKILNCSSRMQTGAHKAMTNFEAILGWEDERILFCPYFNQQSNGETLFENKFKGAQRVTNTQEFHHCWWEQLGSTAKGSRRGIPHKVQEAVTGALEWILGSAMGG